MLVPGTPENSALPDHSPGQKAKTGDTARVKGKLLTAPIRRTFRVCKERKEVTSSAYRR
jgi:hypothetical protein